MIRYIVAFFLLAVLSAFFGFSGLAASFSEVARFLTLIFVVLFIASLFQHLATGKTIEPPL